MTKSDYADIIRNDVCKFYYFQLRTNYWPWVFTLLSLFKKKFFKYISIPGIPHLCQLHGHKHGLETSTQAAVKSGHRVSLMEVGVDVFHK